MIVLYAMSYSHFSHLKIMLLSLWKWDMFNVIWSAGLVLSHLFINLYLIIITYLIFRSSWCSYIHSILLQITDLLDDKIFQHLVHRKYFSQEIGKTQRMCLRFTCCTYVSGFESYFTSLILVCIWPSYFFALCREKKKKLLSKKCWHDQIIALSHIIFFSHFRMFL